MHALRRETSMHWKTRSKPELQLDVCNRLLLKQLVEINENIFYRINFSLARMLFYLNFTLKSFYFNGMNEHCWFFSRFMLKKVLLVLVQKPSINLSWIWIKFTGKLNIQWSLEHLAMWKQKNSRESFRILFWLLIWIQVRNSKRKFKLFRENSLKKKEARFFLI